MAERLNNITYQGAPANFNPRSISLQIRTPEELAAINQFLLTLGRDTIGPTQPPPVPRPQPTYNDHYFDPANLSQLGLVGMPGIPPASFSEESFHAPSQHYPEYHTRSYATYNESPMPYSPNHEYQRRPKYSTGSFSGQHYHHPTPPLESSSPHSTVSTPINTTPPQVPMQMADFDYIRNTRGPSSVAQLAPPVYGTKDLRSTIPLKSVPTAVQHSRPEAPKHVLSLHQNSSSTSSSSSRGSIYPLLTEGDREYKLAPLKIYRSPSPPSTPSSIDSGSPRQSPEQLPGIRSLVPPRDSDELSRQVDSMDLGQSREVPKEDRRRHAELILGLLVSINDDFKRRYPHYGPGEAMDVE